MVLPVCNVTATVRGADGQNIANAVVMAKLSERLTYQGIVVPSRVTARTDASGKAVLELFPNTLVLAPASHYQIIIATPGRDVETFAIVVPNAPSAQLENLVAKDIPPASGDALAQLMQEITQIQSEIQAASKQVETDKDLVDEALKAAQLAESEAEKAAKEGRDSATIAGSAKLTTQVAASDAGLARDSAQESLKSAQTIKAEIDHIYAQILASLKPGTTQSSLSVVVRETLIYKVTAGQTVLQGNDIFGNNLSYTPGSISIYFNGLFLLQTEDYIATDGIKITLTKPAKKNDWIGVLVLEEGGGGGGTIADVEGLQTALDSKYSSQNLPQIVNVAGLPEILRYVEIPPGPGGRKPVISNDVLIYDKDFNQLRPRVVKNLNELVFCYAPEDKGIATDSKKFRLSFPAWYTKNNILLRFTIIGNGQDGDTPGNRSNTLGGRGADVIIHQHLRMANPNFQIPAGATINDYIMDDLYTIDLEDPEGGASLIINHIDTWFLASPLTAVDGSVNWVQQGKSIKIIAFDGGAQKTDEERQAKVPALYTMFYLGAPGGGIDVAFSTGGTGGGGSGGYPGGGSTTAAGGHGGHGWGGGGAAGGDPNKNDPKGSSGMSFLWQYRQPEFATSSSVVEDGNNGLFGGGGGGAGQKGKPGKGGGSIVILEVSFL